MGRPGAGAGLSTQESSAKYSRKAPATEVCAFWLNAYSLSSIALSAARMVAQPAGPLCSAADAPQAMFMSVSSANAALVGQALRIDNPSRMRRCLAVWPLGQAITLADQARGSTKLLRQVAGASNRLVISIIINRLRCSRGT